MSLAHSTVILTAFLCAACVALPIEDALVPEIFADTADYRLPTIITPHSYNITLRPYLHENDGAKRFTFDGEVYINITTSVATKTLVMHTKNLNYTARQYWSTASTTPTPIALSTNVNDSVTDKITYTLTNDLAVGVIYTLHFTYVGSMDDDMHGFYRSSYQDENNDTKWLGSTQFQTNHARRAFPSFDEPRFKAVFHVSIIRHKSLKSVSNTRIINTLRHSDDTYMDVFLETPKMSTYILAFLVSEFNERFNGEFGVIARPEYYEQTKYSFTVGQLILKEFDDYFNLPYYTMGNDKMHMAAIPDFSAGAMENWGLLTYRERALLYMEGSTTLSSKQYIAAVVAHEQAHMWFGDLVTCEWWSYTWLNEGFARYFQYFMTAKVEKDLGLEQQFVVDQIQTVMGMDSTNSTNPMTNEDTNSPADLSRMFNSISYNKGGSVIRMVKHAMGEENFQASLREYLANNTYSNSKPEILLQYWEKHWPAASKTQAPLVFKSFTEQVGYPVVTVNVSTDAKSMTISQKRFLLKSADGSDSKLLYTIPFTYTTNATRDFNTTTPKLYLNATTNSTTETFASAVNWVIANIQETGYYRVNYDEPNWHKIHHALYTTNWDGIHELNRAQIVDDLLNLARSSAITYDLALAVLEYLETELNYLPWTAAFNGYNYLAIRLGTDTKHFGTYIRQLTEKAYKKLGFKETTDDSALDIYNRAKILSWSCKYGNSECISSAKSYFNAMKTTPVPVNIRSVVYCTAMREGSENDFDTLYNEYKEATVATEETLILSSLGCVKDTKLIEKYFDIIVSDSVRRQDKSSALTSLYTENNENVTPVFLLVTEHFEKLAESMGGYSAVASVISGIASRFTEENQKKDLEEFNAENKLKFGSAASTLEAAEATVAENLLWSSNKLGTFKKYLEERGSNGSAVTSAFTTLSLVLVALVAMLLR